MKAPGGREYSYEVWVAQLTARTSEGRVVKVTGTGRTPSEALTRRAANLTRRLGEGGAVEAVFVRGAVTLENYFTEWLEKPQKNGAPLKEQTKNEHRARMKNWILPVLAGPLTDLTTKRLRHFFEVDLMAAGAGPAARVNVHKTLRAVLNGAVRDELLPVNPMTPLTPPNAKAAVQRMDRERADQRMRIAPYLLRWLEEPDCPYHEYYGLVLMMFLGLRRAEVLGMEWSCITRWNSATPTLRVKQQLMRGTDGRYFIQPSTKTGEDREIVLPNRWKVALTEKRKEKRVAGEEWAKDLVFLTPDGKPITYGQFSRIWRQVLMGYMTKDGQKWDEKTYWRPHGNRKVAASLLASEGVPVQTAQTILGHASEAMTFYYSTVSKDAARNGTAALDKGLTVKGSEKGSEKRSKTLVEKDAGNNR